VPPDAAVSTSVPELCVQAPAVPRRLDVDVIAKLAVSVCEPVSPVIVTVEPFARFTFAVSVTVSVLVAPDTGLLCLIVLTLNTGTTTKRGSAPLATPYSAVAGFVMAAWAMEPTLFASAAATLTAGDGCPSAVFVKLKVTIHSVPDTVPPDAAVSTSVPEPSQAPAVPRRLDVDVTGKDGEFTVCEPISPVIVTVEPFARFTFALSVTVSVLVAFDTGVLC
jgi:hypothetical protein